MTEINVKVKHLVEYLLTLDQEDGVMLDKDGWRHDEINPKDEMELIRKRGIFSKWRNNLVINN